jgi:hypothetical protein
MNSTLIITAYERGWLAGFRKQPKANPFASGTENHSDYERGFDDGVFSRRTRRHRSTGMSDNLPATPRNRR